MTNIEIQKILSEADPLRDKELKLLLEDHNSFAALTKTITGHTISVDSIVSLNGEIGFYAGGKWAVFDNLRESEDFFVDIDAQIDPYDFTFKRHLYYWSTIYTAQFKKGGSYNQLKAAIVIVLYKNKGNADLIEEATLIGNLLKTYEDKKQVRLIAVNTAKWQLADTEELKAYLCTLHNGIMTDQNKQKFQGVNTSNPIFKNFQRQASIACIGTKYRNFEEQGVDDMTMKEIMKDFLSNEKLEATLEEGMQKGRQEGVNLMLDLIMQGLSPAEAAQKVKENANEVVAV